MRATDLGERQDVNDMSRPCTFTGCGGSYEEREVIQAVRYCDKPVVIDHVPAEVCSVCGDILLKPETVRKLWRLLREATIPVATSSIYEFT
jgi:YgiT-type zinc finger domain-containing protein